MTLRAADFLAVSRMFRRCYGRFFPQTGTPGPVTPTAHPQYGEDMGESKDRDGQAATTDTPTGNEAEFRYRGSRLGFPKPAPAPCPASAAASSP